VRTENGLPGHENEVDPVFAKGARLLSEARDQTYLAESQSNGGTFAYEEQSQKRLRIENSPR
jgi:hypothetical protein